MVQLKINIELSTINSKGLTLNRLIASLEKK